MAQVSLDKPLVEQCTEFLRRQRDQRRLAEVREHTGVSKRTITRLISGESTNAWANHVEAILRYRNEVEGTRKRAT